MCRKLEDRHDLVKQMKQTNFNKKNDIFGLSGAKINFNLGLCVSAREKMGQKKKIHSLEYNGT